MHGTEQRRLAIETFIGFGHSYAGTIAELGYPDRRTLNSWWRECRETGEVPVGRMIREPRLSDGQKREAAGHCLGHGRSLSRTMRAPGCPKGSDTLRGWADELAPGQRKHRGPNPKRDPVPVEKKVQAIAELEARTGPAAEIAERHGVPRTAPCIWRREMMGDDAGDTEEKGVPASRGSGGLPDDIEVLQDMLREAKMQLRKVQPEPGVRQAALETAEKGQGADPELLADEEKAAMAEALGAECSLCEILPVAVMARSSCGCARNDQAGGGTEEYAAARKAAIGASGASGGTCGCRRVYAQASADAGDGAAIGGRSAAS